MDDREDQQLLEHQSRVYEVLDVATKPTQWVISGFKLLLLGLFLAAIAIGTPFYLWFTGQHVAGGDIITAILALAAVVLFFLAPLYFVVGGVLYFVGTAMYLDQHEAWARSIGFTLHGWVGIWLFLGYVQWGVRYVLTRSEPSAPTPTCTVVPPTTIDAPTAQRETKLTLDSPLPEPLRLYAMQLLNSMADDLEGALAPSHQRALEAERPPDQDSSDINSMPLREAMQLTNRILADEAHRMKCLLDRMNRGEFSGRAEAAAIIREFVGLQDDAVRRLTSMVRRVRREDPQCPTAELEEVVAHLAATRAEIQRIASEKGIL